ncbi:non-ribosomal peptide synthetase [Curtobacterium poinsettiae]|uniref:non-ribosomal peptide synthetase n=1 Tax=Curtobacterium poinsettiae TaxID=159612 RepID=UPI0023604685|nr:non-ribosomal peptide synthetase [Curtobacterium flaccumfaciens]MDD1386004.1 non-ribosomal peptide synthetase [Curtobacterium flaccumfaciens pv. poinsettiae]
MTSIPSAIAEAARRTPDATALVDGGTSLTYRQLASRADRVRAALTARGIGHGHTVVVDHPRGGVAVILALGAMMAGAAYTALALDGSEHVRRRLDSLRPDAVLDAEPDDRQDFVAAGPEPTEGDLAYIVFTSGTTGEPKPVGVPHRAVLRLLGDPRLGLVGGRRIAHTAPLEFDASVYEVWGGLAAGMTVVVVPTASVAEPTVLATYLRQVDVAWLTASVFALVAQHRPDAFDGLERVVAGGEQLDLTSVNTAVRRTVVVNGYGPTENGVFTLLHEMRSPVEEVAIGTPVHGTRVASDPASTVDGTAELVAFGDGLAIGYLGAPDGGFTDVGGERAYRTGDRVRVHGDGVHVFVGRDDRQVKVSGHRIELGAVEAAYVAAGAEAARVVVLADGRLGLVHVGEAEVARVRTALPRWSMPSSSVRVDRIPLLPNGKTDVKAVSALAAGATSGVDTTPASPSWRGEVASAVEATTGRRLADDADDLFAHGIDSIALWRVLMAINDRHGTELTLLDVFASPSVSTIEQLLIDATASAVPSGTLGTT